MNKQAPLNGTLMSMPCSQERRIKEAGHIKSVSKIMGRTMENQLTQPELWQGSTYGPDIMAEMRVIKERCENLVALVSKVLP